MRTKRWIAIGLMCLVMALLGGQSGVKADAGYLLASSVIAGGGGSLQAGGYFLTGTIGQADTAVLASGGYQLFGGFWSPNSSSASNQSKIYLPVMTR
jgi:hypothetical protein